ncbi:MAG: hypothetical protein SPI30_01930 [Prevotella sp.]|nr:hypothetical protein [Prevotella sp.]
MKANEQSIRQIERAIKKIAQKFSGEDNQDMITDIHLRVFQESGELMAFDDDDNEITRCVIEEWIDNKEDSFYDDVVRILRQTLENMRQVTDNFNILKPYSFVLEDEDKGTIAELYVADDDTIIIGGDLMPGLEKDLNDFFNSLLKP